ncbi:hypothetical protein TSL6_02210 [Sulfurovum sp. TSL6]|uniref:GIY-YIG nuclease family protein n=1 Tax=Sulfurovum sp. TSL6 TaxID=2826995 RepID=UPI001CC68008|nr:GIY-YIG nuclease family protein [Sulfurovum sp. TSL6]GIT99714.1 hypothetical protein TSL6_02210 [Sulfurovum sp. TSL6]
MNHENRERKTLKKRFVHFKEIAIKKHGEGRYDYTFTEVDYKRTRDKVRITCNVCNDTFMTFPQSHTSSSARRNGGCKKCYTCSEKIRKLISKRWEKNRLMRINEFLGRMEQRHKGLYQYPLIHQEFKNEHSKITVLCTKCKNTFNRNCKSLKDIDRYAGCEECNAESMIKTIAEKNSARQLRNHAIKDVEHPYGFIYRITNKKNGKFYIGYTNMTAERRFKAHKDESRRLARGHRKCISYLHNAMNYHGIESFVLDVLESFKKITPRELGEIEKEYIAEMNPDYNLSAGGELGRKLVS